MELGTWLLAAIILLYTEQASDPGCGRPLVCYRDSVETLSLTGKRWKMRGTLPTAEDSNLSSFLLLARGIDPLHPTKQIENPGIDPRAFPDLPLALERLQQALRKKETIGIFGDYDCDGITSTALLMRALRRRGVEPVVRLPHRAKEGYGLKEAIVREMAGNGITLLFTLDTGVTATQEIAQAKGLGIDTIILDHHRLPATLPPAYAILHPALAQPQPQASPAAAGVTWAFVQAWEAAEGNTIWDEWPTDIALAAIGTIADLVELRGENRLLAHTGIQALSGLRSGPLHLIGMQAGIDVGRLTSRDIAFRIAPRINAAGRMADPSIALRALLGDHHALLQLEDLNTERQTLVARLTEELLSEVSGDERAFLCACKAEYTPGICGLLAGKLCEKLGRPTLVGSRRPDGLCMASLRSVPGYDVTAALQRTADLLLHFGGHAQAAGCTFSATSFEALQERLNADAGQMIASDERSPTLLVDARVHSRDLTIGLCRELQSLEPFGQANPEPSFLLENVLLREVRPVGKEKNHLQARLQEKKLIGFHLGGFSDIATQPIDLVCHLGIDTWMGAMTPQLFVEDLRPAVKVEVPSMQEPSAKHI
jgi:single-stranded-DNA-specific exonuclease